MWCDHPFSQRNKATKRAVGVEAGEGGCTKFEIKGGSLNYRGEWGILCQLCILAGKNGMTPQ